MDGQTLQDKAEDVTKEETPELPMTIKELAELLDIPLEDCLLPCNFCGKFLDLLEVLDFEKKKVDVTLERLFSCSLLPLLLCCNCNF